MPIVVGKTKDAAQKALEDAGFKVKILEDEDSSKAKNIVLKQSATKASKGATITITVNSYNGGTSNKPTNTVDNSVIDNPPSSETGNNTVSNETEDN